MVKTGAVVTSGAAWAAPAHSSDATREALAYGDL
jgi:hypothetical protein